MVMVDDNKGAENQWERSNKTDEVITAGVFRVKPLLIRCNFWRNSVSNIAERSGSSLHYGSCNRARDEV